MIGLPRDSTWTHIRLLRLMKLLNSIILHHFELRLMPLLTHKRAAHPPIILLMLMLILMFTMIKLPCAPPCPPSSSSPSSTIHALTYLQ